LSEKQALAHKILRKKTNTTLVTLKYTNMDCDVKPPKAKAYLQKSAFNGRSKYTR